MNGFYVLLLLVSGGAAWAAARWALRERAAHPTRFWLVWPAALALGLAAWGAVYVDWWLESEGFWRFLLMMALATGLLGALAKGLRIYPHRPLVYLGLAPALLSLGLLATLFSTVPETAALLVLGAVDGVVLLVAGFDLCSLPANRMVSAERQLGRIASLQKPHPVTLTVVNYSPQPYYVWIRDGVPHDFQPQPDEFQLRLDSRSRATLNYHIHSRRRGAFSLSTVHLRVRSRWGLWQRLMDCPVQSTVHVYPDMKQLSEYALLARTNRLSLLGVRRTRRIGQDNEFERLKDYTVDDNYKHIDWRSTARRLKLTVRDFQTNQSQRLVFLLDCGRMMTNEAAGVTLLDHALNSMLMLSYVALSHGDSVGLICFSDEIHGFVPPTSGLHQMNRLLHASFDRFPRLVESRYDQAFLYLASHCRKRSLVVLVTNLIDEVNANQVGEYLRSFAGRHLPLGVLLRDRRLFEAAEMPHPQDEALFRAAAAAEILTWRHQVLADLDANGVLALDVYPEDLTAPLVNSYLEIKARHLL